MANPNRVVITGGGAISSIGTTLSENWTSLLEGKSGISAIQHFPTDDFQVKWAAPIHHVPLDRTHGPFRPNPTHEPNLTIKNISEPKDLRKSGRFTHLGLLAGFEAYESSGLDAVRAQTSGDRFAANIGVGIGGLGEIEEELKEALDRKTYKRVSPFFITQSISNMAAGQLSLQLKLTGPNYGSVSACASSAHSIGESFRMIQRGEADVVLAGGAEAAITPLGIAGFQSMRALCKNSFGFNEKCSRPFDQKREGFVMGEGAAVLILENLDHAIARGATIWAELIGYGASSDAYHITSPAPRGSGGRRAVEGALRDARMQANDIDFVNCHATSTPLGDELEAQALYDLSEKRTKLLPVHSTKSQTGHLLGAAGAIEALFAIQCLRNQILLPNRHLVELDEELRPLQDRLDFTVGEPKKANLNVALSNSFGFGGTNVSLLFRAWEGR